MPRKAPASGFVFRSVTFLEALNEILKQADQVLRALVAG
jgi:hypothetical protein